MIVIQAGYKIFPLDPPGLVYRRQAPLVSPARRVSDALVAQQPVEGLGLQGEEAGDFQRFVDAGKGNATWTRCGG